MTADAYRRHIPFEEISNFRDLGGYRTQGGHTIAWRNLFRSGSFQHMTRDDLTRLREEIGVTSVIDLRSTGEVEKQGIGLLMEAGIEYYSLPFITSSGERRLKDPFSRFSNIGEFYLYLVSQVDIGRRVVDALEVIAEPKNYPLVFYCAMGKDRTGILAAILLSLLGVSNENIIEDYVLSGPHVEKPDSRMDNDPRMSEFVRNLPGYFFEAVPESMALFLSTLQQEHGSIKGYVTAQGASASLYDRLHRALLI